MKQRSLVQHKDDSANPVTSGRHITDGEYAAAQALAADHYAGARASAADNSRSNRWKP